MQYVLYTKYVLATGEIVGCGRTTGEENALLQADELHGVVLGMVADDETEYLVGGETLTPRPSMGLDPEYSLAADGVAVLSLDVPAGALVHFNGEKHPVDAGIQFRTNVPGEYLFEITPPFPYMPQHVLVRAV